MPVGQIYEVELQYAIASRELSCKFGYKMTAGTPDANVCQNLADRFHSAISVTLQGMLATDCSLQCLVARSITKDDAIPGYHYYAAGTIGTQSGFAIPSNSAMVMKFLTDNIKPVHNGRKYMAGIPELQLGNGQLKVLYLDGAVKNVTNLLDDQLVVVVGGDETFDPCVVNRVDTGIPIIPPTSSAVTSVMALPIIYQQRRRRTKRTQIAS